MVIVTDEAFDEILDRVELVSSDPRLECDGGHADPIATPRQQFVAAVDRAVNKVIARGDGRVVWYTQTLRRFGCRLHFFCTGHYVYLVACVAHGRKLEDVDDAHADGDGYDEDYST